MNSPKKTQQQETRDQLTSQLLDRTLIYTPMSANEWFNLRTAAIETNNMELFVKWQKGKYFDFTKEAN